MTTRAAFWLIIVILALFAIDVVTEIETSRLETRIAALEAEIAGLHAAQGALYSHFEDALATARVHEVLIVEDTDSDTLEVKDRYTIAGPYHRRGN